MHNSQPVTHAPQESSNTPRAVWVIVALVVATVAAAIVVSVTVADEGLKWSVMGGLAGSSVALCLLVACVARRNEKRVELRQGVPHSDVKTRDALIPALEALPLVPPNTPIFALKCEKGIYQRFRKFWSELIVQDTRYAKVRLIFKDTESEIQFCYANLEMLYFFRLIPDFPYREDFLEMFKTVPRYVIGIERENVHSFGSAPGALRSIATQIKNGSHWPIDMFHIPESQVPGFTLNWLEGHFAKGRSLVVAQTYNDKTAVRFLRQMMPLFQKWGVTTLVLEAFCFDTMQPDLDELYRTKQMPVMVENLTKSLDAGWGITGCGMHELVHEATLHNMRIVGCEVAYFRSGTRPERNYTLERNLSSHPIVKTIKGPYVLLSGRVHCSSSNQNRVLGYREMFHEPLLWAYVGEKDSVRVNYTSENHRVDIYVTLAKEEGKGA